MNKKFFVAALASFALTSCATTAEKSRGDIDQPCSAGPASNVSVQNGRIVVASKKICVRGPNQMIVWTLTTPGYVFAENGIVIDSNDGEFLTCVGPSHGSALDSGRAFMCGDKNAKQAGANYPYTVHLKRTDGTAAPMPVDPIIVNY